MLARLVGPDNVDSVVFVDRQIGVPHLVKSGIGDLGGVDEGFAPRRNHGVVEVEVVSGPNQVDVSGTVGAHGCLRVGSSSPVHDLDGFGDDDGAGTDRNRRNQQRRHDGKHHERCKANGFDFLTHRYTPDFYDFS